MRKFYWHSILAVILTAGCAQDPGIVRVRAQGQVTDRTVGEVLRTYYSPKRCLAIMAALATNVFGPDTTEGVSCAGPDGLIPLPSGWERLKGEFAPIQEGSEVSGVTYEHWINFTDLDHRLSAIVCRGTEGPGDCCANLRYF